MALVAGPILVDLLLSGWDRVFSYFAADVYYYLSVARNFARQGFFTFDGDYPTNGFHPLWQILLGFFYTIFDALSTSEPVILTTVLLLSLGVLSFGVYWIVRGYVEAKESATPLVLFLPVGTYAVCVSVFYHPYGTLWAYANGMETAFVLLFFGLILHRMTRPAFMETRASAVGTGLILGLLLLSRLDHAFFAAALLGALAVRAMHRRDAAALGRAVTAGLVCGGILGVYLVWNLQTAGALLPVSGTVKSTFPHPRLTVFQELLSMASYPEQGAKRIRLWRDLQILLPMGVAAAALFDIGVRAGRGMARRIDFPFLVTAVFVLLLGSYNLFFVHLMAQGHWYFPVSIVFTSLFTIDVVERVAARAGLRPRGKLSYVMVALVVLFFTASRSPERNQEFRDFYWIEAPAAVSHYGANPPRLVEYDDGIISYFTGFSTMSGFAYAIDKAGADAYLNRELPSLALNRGYGAMASYTYMDNTGLDLDSSSEEIEERLTRTFSFHPGEVSDFDFSVDYVSPSGRFCVIKFR